MIKNNRKTKVAIIIFLITAIIATALTAVLAFGDSNEGYRTITVIEIQGTVGVVHDNIEYSAYTGMHLEEGYTVVTGGNSYIRLLLDDDKYVKLESGTKAVFSEVSGGKTAINIERGSLVAEVTKPLQVDEDFIVNTPNAVLAVRGTLFRVDLSRNDKGELNTDVMTYGGAVSSKRIQPTGEIEDIEVTIKEGFKATVNMDDKETVYLVDEVKVDLSALVGKPSDDNKLDNTTTETDINGDIIENAPITLESVLMPIVVEDIPDDDLVDIYFASENGHSMFIETKEIEEKIAERDIDVMQKTSVYEVAEKVVKPVGIVIPDDNKSLVTTTEPVTEVVAVQGPPNDGIGDKTTTEITTEPVTTEPTTVTTTKAPTATVPTTTTPTTTIPSTTVPSTTAPTTTFPSTTVPTTESTTVTTTEQTTEPTTEETTVHTHTEVTEEVKATCTENGLKTVKCSTCGETISETVLEATGHSEIFSGAKDAHTECENCYEILSADHTYQTSTTNSSCTLDGGTTYVCECGYNYTDTIPATGHTEVDGAAADIHTKCKTCGETLEDGTYHTYTDETTQNTCTTAGEVVHNCTCGWSYTEEIPAGHKKSDDGLTCSGCGGVWVELNSTNFPDSMFLSYISTTYDSDGNNALIGDEVTGVVTINVSGDSSTDGGYTDLTGIKSFTNLTTVNCAYNVGITSLDLSGLTSLTNLDITGLTGLKTLNISGCTNLTDEKITGLDTCTALTELNASGCANIAELNLNANKNVEAVNLSNCNALTSFVINDNSTTYALSSIDLTGCTSLETLTINNALSLTTVDFTDTTAIKTIDLGGCQYFAGAVDLSGKTSLTTITMGANKVTSLNVTGCTALTDVNMTATTTLSTIQGINTCTELATLNLVNTGIGSLDLSSNNKLTKVLVTNCASLTYLDLTRSIESTTLSSLNINNCTALTNLNLYNCKGITSLAISSLTALETLNLSYSGVETFNGSADTMNFSANTALKNIYLNGIGMFTGVDVSANTLLEEFSLVDNTMVTSLDFSSNTKLKKLTLSDVTALTTLNVTSCTALESFNVLNTGLTTLSVTASSALTTLNVYDNTALTSFELTGATQLEIAKFSAGMSNTVLTNLVLTNCGITSLDVTYLTSLKTLDVSDCARLTAITGLDNLTNLTTLNVNGCTNLGTVGTIPASITELTVYNSGLTALDASDCIELTSIDVSGCTSLVSLNISNTKIETIYGLSYCSSLDTIELNNINLSSSNLSIESNYVKNILAKNIKINYFSVSSQSLKSLDITGSTIGDGSTSAFSLTNCNSTLETLTINNSNISMLPYDNFTELKTLNAENCLYLTGITSTINNVETIDISGCTGITSSNVNFANYTELKRLDVGNTGITSINVGQCTKLENLDITGCTEITTLNLSVNLSLTTLNASGCTNLSTLELGDNAVITDLNLSDCENLDFDISSFTSLVNLNMSGTAVAYIDASSCVNLKTLDVSNCTLLDTFAMTVPDGVTAYEYLESVTFAGCIKLNSLQIEDASILSVVDLSDAEELDDLILRNCPNLTSLDLSDCTTIRSVIVTDSGLTSGSVTLPAGKDESIITGLS